MPEPLIPPHGGYRKLKSFQVAQLAYDLTVRFVKLYVDKYSRTCDQMVQAARSGVQNIAEGSMAAGTSKKTELKLTNVARASLEELRLDYEDFLRQRGREIWDDHHPAIAELRRRKPESLADVRAWMAAVKYPAPASPPAPPVPPVPPSDPSDKSDRSDQSLSHPAPEAQYKRRPSYGPDSFLAAQAALTLIVQATTLLDRQLERLAADFTNEGGFTERLYRVRSAARK